MNILVENNVIIDGDDGQHLVEFCDGVTSQQQATIATAIRDYDILLELKNAIKLQRKNTNLSSANFETIDNLLKELDSLKKIKL
jgi:uncharacterized protein YjcR